MMRVNEFFFDQDPPPQFMGQTSAQQIIRDPKLFTEVNVPAAKPANTENMAKNDPIVMRVSICCMSCEDIIKHDLHKVKGVKNVECDIYRHKVTVTGTAHLADVLSAAKKSFDDAELWD